MPVNLETQAKYQSLPGVNWGTSVVSVEDRVDPTKTYRTVSGKRVFGLEVVMKNSCGDEVTFPVKGAIVVKEKPLCVKYQIWTLDGRAGVLSSSSSSNNLIEVTT